MQNRPIEDTQPWYKQFWPWFLIALPGSIVIAGITMIFIASHKADSLVKDNYYKEGLAINRDLALDRTAAARGIAADLVFANDGSEVQLTLRGGVSALPAQLQLQFFHPTEKARDFSLALNKTPADDYIAAHDQPIEGRWYVQIAGEQPEPWRLKGEINRRDQSRFTISPTL